MSVYGAVIIGLLAVIVVCQVVSGLIAFGVIL